jgi:hypothetical protein
MADIDEVNRSASAAGGEQTARSFERAKAILAELAEATRAAAESIRDEQRQRAAQRVTAAAEAMRSAAQCFERSENPGMARYAHRTADRIEDFSREVRGRHWSEILADTEDFARRQPTFFVLGAAAAGFVAARLLLARKPGSAAPHDETEKGKAAGNSGASEVASDRPRGARPGARPGATLGSTPGAAPEAW